MSCRRRRAYRVRLLDESRLHDVFVAQRLDDERREALGLACRVTRLHHEVARVFLEHFRYQQRVRLAR